MDHIGKSLEQLRLKQRASAPGVPLPARTVERYAKIDADVTRYESQHQGGLGLRLTRPRTGEELRSLSRFQAAQRTGFTKILKKYRRWTKDKGLHPAFKQQIANKEDSLFKLDLSYLLDHYMRVLGPLRAIFDHDGASAADYNTANDGSAAPPISKALASGDELDFDLAMTMPLGSHGNRATYWIHPDHVVEVQVLLLQQMRLYGSRDSQGEDEVGLLVLDHTEAFAMKQNASTIGSTESTKGVNVFKAAGNVLCVSSGDAAVVLCDDSKGQKQPTSKVETSRLRLKSLQNVLSARFPSLRETNGDASQRDSGKSKANGHDDVVGVQQWLVEHKEIDAIAGVGSKRTRFVGLHNKSAGGIWATLDKDVYMKSSLSRDIINNRWPFSARAEAIEFPHAILEVRREGAQATSLIQTLDRSHLVRCSHLDIGHGTGH